MTRRLFLWGTLSPKRRDNPEAIREPNAHPDVMVSETVVVCCNAPLVPVIVNV